MTDSRGGRVLVAVEPVVLEGAFAVILELIGLDEVVQFHGAEEAERGASYDAAIVSAEFPGEFRAAVLITLPEMQHAGGLHPPRRGHVTTGDLSNEVDIRDQREVISLLDRYVPTALSREHVLAKAQRGLRC